MAAPPCWALGAAVGNGTGDAARARGAQIPPAASSTPKLSPSTSEPAAGVTSCHCKQIEVDHL